MRNILVPLLTFLQAILFVSPLAAQNCGCVEEENCPETIAAVSNFNVCYTFTDAFNNDLSDPTQGVCGVNLAFTHDYIWDLEMTLISPNGTEVMLVGENTMGTGGTTFTSWDVQFVACGDVAVPDGTYEPVWTNDQVWPFIGAIGGSYYPVAGGCLEDFNSGAVNGEWCIEVNSESFTGGTILDFEVILCDQSGIFCCDANGGDLDDELNTCEGDESLVLDLEVEYSNLPPDDALYGYTFLIGEVGGLLLEVNENPDLTAYAAGTYEVCGLSYDLAEDAFIPMPDGVVTMQDIKDDLNGLNPSFCASLSDDCYPVTIGAPPIPTALLDTICIGEDYMIGDSTFSEGGDYDVIFNSFFDCDSLVNLTLTVLPIDTAFIVETICLGDSLVVSDSTFYETGNYEVYLAGASRCDSTYLVDLIVVAPVVENIVTTICEGDSYEVGTMSYNATGIYSDTIISIVTGCDSIINLDLEVISVQAQVAPPDNITCENSVVTLDGSLSSDEPGTTYEWTEFAGGNILPPNDQSTVQVSDNGLYKFKVTRFGCSDSVFVNVLQLDDIPNSEAGIMDSLTCNITSLQLDGTASEMGTDIVYNWFTDVGSITENGSTLMPTIDLAPATYSLSVMDTVTGCADTSSVFISLSNDAPAVDAGDDLELTCTETSVLLDGSGSYVGEDFTYVWTDFEGTIIPPIADAQATSTATGIYTFTITNIDTGCSASDDMEVTSNINLPIIDAGMTDSLTCEDSEIQLSGTINNSVDFTILWTDETGGSVIIDENTLTPTIDEPGLYYFTVTDNDSNCPVVDSVLVVEVVILPDADAGPDTLTLSCLENSWSLGDVTTTSTGDNFSQAWYLNDALVSMDFPYEVNTSGTYILTVTNDLTGCERNDTIVVAEDVLLPMADAGDDLELNCTETSVLLDGSDSYIGEDFTYVWTNSSGTTLTPTADAQATTTEVDIYTFTVTNIETGCSDSDDTEVTINVNLPIVDAGVADSLTCENNTLQLLGTVNNSTDFTVLWTENVVSDENTLTPTINEPGWYFFTVTDTMSNCTAADSVLVLESVNLPNADAGPETVTLNCLLESWPLGDIDDTSLGDDFSQEWYLNDALVSSDFPYEVSEAGTYILIVTNDLTACEQSDTIEVVKNLLQPIADAGDDFELNCEIGSIILDGEEIGELPDDDDNFIDYAWYNEDNELIQFGEDSLLVVNPGMYYLVLSENITFCADTAYVNITQDASVPVADAGMNAFLDCATGVVDLDGTDSSMGDYSYEWAGPAGATIIGNTTLMPTVNTVGTYILEVTSNTDDCSDLDEVEITIDTAACQPTIVLSPGFETFGNGIDGIVDCLTDDQAFISGVGYFLDTLDASGTMAPGGNIAYGWTALTGFIIDEDDPQFPIVTEGVFILTITNTLLNLSVSDTISVINIRDFPNADAGPNDALTCVNFQNGYILDGTLSDQGGEFSYLWTTDFGDFGSSDITSLTPTVFGAGTYELLVTNNTNGCEANAAVLLSLDGQIPSPCFNNEVQMECANPSIMIGDTCDVNPDYLYAWTVIQDGTIIGADNEATIEVQTDTSLVSALFEVVVTDNFNSCTFIDTVEVFTAVNCYPDCMVDTETDTLTCLNLSVTLDGTGSSEGGEYDYLWERIGGVGGLCGDEETLMPCVDASGFYRLTITNTQTGFECQSPLVFVNANDNPPDVEIDDSDNPAFTCNTDLLTLSATSDDTDAYTFAWSSTEDCILTDTSAPQVDINCEAIYTLTATDINTGCENISDITISYDTLPPALVVVNPNMASIGCSNPQVVLSGSGSSQGFYTWYRDGILIAGATNLSYVANVAGEYCLEVTDMNNGCIASSCATVEADADAVFADAGDNQFLTCSVNSVTLMGDAPAGFEFSYQWSTDAGTNCFSPATGSLNITATCPGTYTLTVTDFTNGCTGASSVEVIDMTAPPIVNAGPDMELDCNITEVTLDGSASEENPDFIYNWVGADGQGAPSPPNSLTPTATAPGLYTLLILNSNTNCFDIDSVVVIQNADLPEVIAGEDDFLTCNDMEITLDGSESEQNDSLTYIWTAEDGTGIISSPNVLEILVNEDGNYILSITNDSTNCTNTDTILVAMDTLSPLPIIIAENESNINCFQDTISLDAANSEPIGDLDYQWQTTSGSIISSANLAEISLNQGGNYVLSLTNTDNGCTNDTTIVVQQDFVAPTINIAEPDMLTCVVQSVELNAATSQENSLFEWTSVDGFLIDNSETATPTVFEPGEYTLKLSSQDNGCEDEETIIVPEDITPPVAVANVEGTLDCVTNSVILSGEGSSADVNNSYQWEGISPVENETELVTTAFAAGDYSLIVINGNNGCQDTAMVEVIASGFPITDLLTTNTNPNCADISSGFIQIDSVIGGNAPYYFSFDGSVFSEFDYRNYLTAGNYQIAVEDADGCEYEVSILLEENQSLLIDLGADIEIEIGDSIELSVQINLPEEAIDTIIWRPLPDENCAACPEQMITPSESMNVLVEVVDTFGCSATDNIFLYVIGGEESPVFVPTAFSPNSDGSNDELIVFGKSDVQEIELFQIFDRWGEMVYEAKDFLPEDPDANWDGNHHDRPLNPQVFAWRMQYRIRSTGELRIVWGNVTLVR